MTDSADQPQSHGSAALPRLVRATVLIALLFGTLIGTLIATREAWMAALARHALADVDAELTQLDGVRLGWRSLGIAVVGVRQGEQTLLARDIRIRWRWPTLLRTSRLAGLHIRRLDARLDSIAASTETSATNASIVLPDPTTLLENWPVDSTQIAELSLRTAAPRALRASGRLALDAALLDARLQIHYADLTLDTAFTADSAGGLTLELTTGSVTDRASGQGHLRWTGTMTTAAGQTQVQGQLAMQARALDVPNRAGALQLSGAAQGPVAFTTKAAGARLTLALDAQFELAMSDSHCDLAGAADAPLTLSLDASATTATLPAGWHATCRGPDFGELTGQLERLHWRGDRAEVRADWRWRDSARQANGEIDLVLQAEAGTGSWQLIGRSAARIESLAWPQADARVEALALTLTETGGRIRFDADGWRVEGLRVAAASARLDSLALPLQDLQLSVDATLDAAGQQLQAPFVLSTADGLLLRGRLDHQAATEPTRLSIDEFTVPLDSSLLHSLQRMALGEALSLGGRLGGSGSLIWDDGLAALSGRAHGEDLTLRQGTDSLWGGSGALTLTLGADDMNPSSGHLQAQLQFQQGTWADAGSTLVGTGIELDIEAQQQADGTQRVDALLQMGELVTPWLSIRPLALDATGDRDAAGPWSFSGVLQGADVDPGWPARDLDCALRGELPRISTTNCSLQTLGGRVQLEDSSIDLTTLAGRATVLLDGLDLGALLALQNDPQLDGAGVLDGRLPLRWADGRPSIAGGRVQARGPGRLSYTGGRDLRSATSQPGLALALRALEDFRYQTLGSSVDYDADGLLDMGVKLQGSNPDIEQGRAIDFNLNVSQNLPVLLRSLRLSDNLNQRIQRRLQQDRR